MKYNPSRARGLRPRSRGFTLVEVLVALTIIAVALMAALRATASLTSSASQLRQRTLAQWSAENYLAQTRLQRGVLPPLGRSNIDCSQADVALICEIQVFPTQHPLFRRVEVGVYPADGERYRLARLIGFATLEQQ